MPARIMIQTGISAGTSHPIERPVIRIGSDPQADVCLPTSDVAPHALTVEYRQGGYRVYNRSSHPIYLGSQLVLPNEMAGWPDTDILQLDEGTALVLDVDEDPQPAPARERLLPDWSETDTAATASPPSPAVDTPSPANARNRQRAMFQVVVIVACFGGCVLLVLRDRARQPQVRNLPSFSSLVAESLADEQVSRDLIGRLQYAEAAVVRGRSDLAAKRFGSLRDDLIHSEPAGLKRHEFRQRILDFIELRLQQLER